MTDNQSPIETKSAPQGHAIPDPQLVPDTDEVLAAQGTQKAAE